MKYIVYLAGPIKGKTFNDTTGWREKMEDLLPTHIACASPMRMKDYLKTEVEGNNIIKSDYPDTVMSNQRAIFKRDKWDVQRCDVLFANLLEADTVSIGTMFELAWATIWKKPIVIAMDAENDIHDHPFVRESSGFIVNDLESAASVISAICYPPRD